MSNVSNTILLNRSVIECCLDFARQFIGHGKSGKDFGNTSIIRNYTDRTADIALGKLGEFGFREFLRQFELEVEVDMNLYQGKHSIDFGQDISSVETVGGTHFLVPRVDIKTSKSNSRWLLIEDHKMWPSILIFMTVDIESDIESNIARFNQDCLKCTFTGYALWADLFDQNQQPWFQFSEGDRLLDARFVECMYKKALKKSPQVVAKEQLYEHYNDCLSTFSSRNLNPRYGPKLKCPRQYGLPISGLRSDIKQTELLVNLLRKSTISQSFVQPLLHIQH